MTPIHIVKADGEREAFEPRKLLDSLTRAGASVRTREQILRRITQELSDGMSTGELYHRAFTYLKEMESEPVAARYSIKRAVFDLGPSGFPFEQFVAELLKAQGWQAQTGVAMTGKCAPHEVDVRAEKNGVVIGVEAKFHNTPGGKTDLKDALYVHARFEDLKQAPDPRSKVDEGWLITNTRFTRNALRYGRCSGLHMIGWDYPRGRGIQALIEESGIHPLTCLTTLSDTEKAALLERNVVLCRSIKDGGHLLQEAGIHSSKIPNVLSEARQVCVPIPKTYPENITPHSVFDTHHVPAHH